ncbi:hemerythrin domain-containing protein, partial [Streptomyces sp. NPDC127574]
MTRTIKEQTVEQMGGPDSVLTRQRRDHAAIDRLMNRYRSLSAGRGREHILREIIQRVFSHAFAEETVLWPVVRHSVPNGEELTGQVEEEHQEINDLVADIERRALTDPERLLQVEQAFEVIQEDIRDEEDDLLPRLQE